jgi:hypothetical protein
MDGILGVATRRARQDCWRAGGKNRSARQPKKGQKQLFIGAKVDLERF